MSGIYIHIPFCKKACHYCNFHFSTTFDNYRSQMIDSICKELELKRSLFKEVAIRTVYFGGGTPSILENKEIDRIWNALSSNYNINSVEEITFGTDIRFSPIIGTNLGITFYESLYDRVLDPQIRETIVGGPDPDYSGDTYYLTYLTNSADPEIAAMYSNSSNASGIFSAFDDFVKSSRKALGFNFSSVIKNISIQGEYGALLEDYNMKNLKSSPKASVLSSFFQFDNFV